MITSRQNPKLKLVRALASRAKERREAGAFLAEGVRLVEEVIAADWPIRFVLYADGISERGLELIELLNEKGLDVEQVSSDLMQSLSDTETSQGMLAVLNEATLPIPETPDFILIPDQIRDPGNLGTLLRTADAAGVQAILLPPESTDAFAPKVVRAGMGAHFRLPIHLVRWDEIRTRLQGMKIFLADANATQSYWKVDFKSPFALIVGGEAEGASQEARRLAATSVGIPMPGRSESLNAGVAGSILMFEAVRQRSVMHNS